MSRLGTSLKPQAYIKVALSVSINANLRSAPNVPQSTTINLTLQCAQQPLQNLAGLRQLPVLLDHLAIQVQ